MARLTRAARKELTTSQLLDTARAVFLERGYHRSSLGDIAEAAGFTKGAVYARFASKDDLFLALLDNWIEERTAEVLKIVTRYESFEEFMRGEARRITALRRKHRDWYLLWLEFWIHSARDPRLRGEFVGRHNRVLETMAGMVQSAAAESGAKLRLPALDFARATSAMALGMTLERLADPAGVPESLLEWMLTMLTHEGVALKSRTGSPETDSGDGVRARNRTRRKNGTKRYAAGARSR